MTRTGLLLVRVPPSLASAISLNPAVCERWDVSLVDDGRNAPAPGLHKAVFGIKPADSFETVSKLIAEQPISHAIILTPYSVFGEGAVRALEQRKIPFLWSEVFPGNRLLLDRLGCQYTDPNEISYESRILQLDPDLPIGSRFPQPQDKPIDALHKIHGKDAVVVFGQVPNDHSLLHQPAPSYPEWLDLLFTSNPSTRFLFKHHPIHAHNPMGLTPGIGCYPNVRVINESIHSLFKAYDAFAAYGSTTVLEGVALGLSFATHGRHFADRSDLVLRVSSPSAAKDLLGKLRSFKPNLPSLRRRLSFLTRYYAFRPNDPRIATRILLSSEAFFSTPCPT